MLSSPAAAGGLDLATFLAEVEGSHPAIEAAKQRAAAAAHRIGPAGSWDDPFLAVGPDGIAGGDGEPRLVRWQISQSIPFPGKRAARADAARERATASAADAETIARSVRVVAIQTFYQTLHNQTELELNAGLRRLIEEATASGEARYRTGDSAHHEWLLARAELGVLDADRVRLESRQRSLHAALNELRGLAPDAPVGDLEGFPAGAVVPPAEIPESPEAGSLAAASRAAEAERRSASLAYFPDLLVQGMVEQPRQGMEGPMWGAMLGVSLPVFWNRKQDELLAAATREREAADAERRALENRLGAEVVEARATLAAAVATVELYESSVLPLTRLAVESSRSAYVVARISLPELVSVARTHEVQQLEHLGARIDVELARTRIAELLSSPPVLRLAPAMPTLFGGGMGAGGGGAMPGPSAVRVGRGIGLGAARGTAGAAGGATGGGTPGMGGM